MAKLFKSKFKLVKRYARFSNTCVYFLSAKRKKVRYGYKVYQKVFIRYRGRRGYRIRINVKKPRVRIKRKTKYGRALEIKQKLTYLVGGIKANRIKKYVKISTTKVRSSIRFLLGKLESRLDFVLYRINIIQSPRRIKQLIRFEYVDVNEEPESNVNFNVKQGIKIDVRIPNYAVKRFEFDFEEAILRRTLFKPSTYYVESSYTTFRAIMHSMPDEDTTFYPFDFNPFYFFRLYVGS